MGFFDGALAELQSIVSNGAGEHDDMLHNAIRSIESNPQQFADTVGKLTNHPEIGDDVRSWMSNPQAQALLSHVDAKAQAQPGDATVANQ